ncbi:hypothetical protein E2C01_071548 [Portunus trituberculatus]|uniref:Uncharacterized protein n=1 Tax=Portunus trituberculatus TaxID=210409 RepID=A0A5B7I478_PORTR|nr:hypothetical protein [Portunus trituberculatus]
MLVISLRFIGGLDKASLAPRLMILNFTTDTTKLLEKINAETEWEDVARCHLLRSKHPRCFTGSGCLYSSSLGQ